MSMEERRVLDYVVVCVSEFAQRCGLKIKEAFLYLHNYQGIAFLREFYDVEHTLSFDDVVDDLIAVCRQNGGAFG